MIDITIICENKVGMLSFVTEEFKKQNINLADISVHVLGEKGIITLSLEDTGVCLKKLEPILSRTPDFARAERVVA